MAIRPLRVSPERVRWDGETTQLNISFHPAWQVRRHWGVFPGEDAGLLAAEGSGGGGDSHCLFRFEVYASFCCNGCGGVERLRSSSRCAGLEPSL